MELTFTRRTKIADVKKQFSGLFPFLKLEFYPGGHAEKASSVFEKALADRTFLSDLSSHPGETAFFFTPATTVGAFEQRLQHEWGLPVQVFRKAGNLWVETTQTDNLSLEKQNSIGKESLRPVRFNRHTLFL